MKLKNRIFKMSEQALADALTSFSIAQKNSKRFNSDELKKPISDESGEVKAPAVIEIVNRIEDFANIIFNNGFDPESLSQVSVDELSSMMEDFVQDAAKAGIAKDFSINTLGFVVQQTITRLVSMMETPDMEAWTLVSRELVMKQGSVLYNVMVGTDGHATSRIAEGGEYNTFRLESTEDYIKTSGGKVGIMASYSEEALQNAGVQAIKMLTQAALSDMKRFKSLEAVHLLEANAKDYFDGLDPNKMPSGRSYKEPKKSNGTILMRDLEKFFGETQAMGYDVDYMFINPLAYALFINEPNVREYLEKNANVKFLVPKKRKTIFDNYFTSLTKKTSGTAKAAEGHEVIGPLPIRNKAYTIIVTPIVKFHTVGSVIYTPKTRYTANKQVAHAKAPNNCADILLVDSSRALTYVHDGRGIMTETIENKLRDVTQIKFKTYYSFILDKDHGVFAFRNINITDDVFDPYQKLQVNINHSELFPAA